MARGILYSSMTSTGASVSCARLLALHFSRRPIGSDRIRILGMHTVLDRIRIFDRCEVDLRSILYRLASI